MTQEARTAAAGGISRASRLSSSDQVVRDIIHGLYEGRFVAGQRLVEPDLMRLYGVSRGTIREAIKQLAAEGVATLTTFRGAHIRHLSRAEARDILQLLEMVIGLAARLAASNMDGLAMRPRFVAAYEALMGFADAPDSYEFVRARNRFYRAMTLAGGNRELARLMPSFHVHLIRTQIRPPQRERFADYRAIAEAILAGNARAAEAAGRRHLKGIMKTLDAAPASAFAADAGDGPARIEDEDFSIV